LAFSPAASFCNKVRDFVGHQSPVTALAIVPDSLRFVVSATSDAGLYIWDLSAGVCVGQVRMPSPVSSLSFHPDALFLVTTHVGEKGAYLWTNNLRYGFVPDMVHDLTVLDRAPLLHFPVAHVEQQEAEVGESAPSPAPQMDRKNRLGEDDDIPLFDASADMEMLRSQKDTQRKKMLNEICWPGLRLSGVPLSVWSTLPLLDQIKQKNQPILPPKKQDVPFFLPSTSELRPTFIVSAASVKGGSERAAGPGRTTTTTASSASSPFEASLEADDFAQAMAALLTLSANEIDLELKRSVGFTEDTLYTAGEIEHMEASACRLLRFLTFWVKKRENADLVQGMLADVVKAHGRVMSRMGPEVLRHLKALGEAQDLVRQELEHLYALPNAIVAVSTGAF
jgi:U3 small nucleolar RNA-associated protein 21